MSAPEWTSTKLACVTSKIGSGATPRGGKESYKNEGIALIRSLNVYDFQFDRDNLAFIDDAQAAQLDNVIVQADDILLNITGASVARCCMVPANVLPARVNQHVAIVRVDETRAHGKFVYYCINSSRYKHHLLTLAQGGATREALTKQTIEDFEVALPDLPTQRRIASILSAYDNLIENNTRRIAILEEVARRIYEEWFVRFRFPGHENVRMVESELGPVPEGWLSSFPNHVDFLEGPGLRNWQYRPSGTPFLNIRTLVSNDIDMSKVQFVDTDDVKLRYSHFLVKPDDHVVSSSGTLGRIVTIRNEHLPLMLNTSIIRMRPRGIRMGCWLLKGFLRSDYFQNQIQSVATGAAQKNFGPSHLKQMFIIAPTENVAEAFENLVGPMEVLLLNLVRRNSNLRTTRDLLLPKLISGELDVSALPESEAITA